MFKYGRMQRKIPSRLVCGSRDACLDCVLPGVQVTFGLGFFFTAGLGFFSAFKSFALTGLAFSQVPSGIVNKEIHT